MGGHVGADDCDDEEVNMLKSEVLLMTVGELIGVVVVVLMG